MNTISKEALKQAVITSLEVFEEIKKEKGVSFLSEDSLIKVAISLYIQESRNGNGHSNGNANGFTKEKPKADVPLIVNFGKYKGKTLEELVKIDRSYVNWLAAKSEIEKIRLEAKKLIEANPVSTGNVTIPKPKAFQK
ncbi:MAG: hypothetical protein A2252_09120 [Elusimicrobia bacterium RIFOXYA2_FULL_39_19]|nr:MAG: hypothetical protein A2252_09120 [Elusimicrobia bacterium RIFOXYA2_FULL_39_19]